MTKMVHVMKIQVLAVTLQQVTLKTLQRLDLLEASTGTDGKQMYLTTGLLLLEMFQ